MKPRFLILRDLFGAPKHLTGPGKIEPALRRQVVKRSKYVVCAVEVSVQRGEFVLEGVADETLCGEVVTLVRVDTANNAIKAREAFQRGGVKLDVIENVSQPPKVMIRIFQGHTADDPVHTIPFLQEEL